MIILKLGGSIITKKESSTSQIDYDNLNRISKEIKTALDNKDSNLSLQDGLIIVHGAGSFGHPPAKKYKIGQVFDIEEYDSKRIGFSKTQNAVNYLNTEVCKNFIENEIPCVCIQASSFITTENKRIKTGNLDLIEKYLEEGYVPVIYGDPVIDSELKMAILSGDQIIQYFARNLLSKSNNDNKVILGTDVDGVYTKNPKTHDDAEHLDKVSSIDDIEALEAATTVDVTGGMVGKIKELLELADIGINSKIINVNKEDYIRKALENEDIFGTIISK